MLKQLASHGCTLNIAKANTARISFLCKAAIKVILP